MSAAVTDTSAETARAERWRVVSNFAEWCLRREATRVKPFLMLVYSFAVVFFCSMPVFSSRWRPQHGADVLNSLFCSAAAILLIGGIGHAAQAVCWEVSRELRDMVRLTGLSAGTLLWCKTLARWWTIGWSLLLLVPFGVFAITLGGVTGTQLLAGCLWLLIFAALTAGFALVASVSATEAENAATTVAAATFFLMLFYHLAFWFGALAGNLLFYALHGVNLPAVPRSWWSAVSDFCLNAAPVSGLYRLCASPASFSPFDPTYWLHFLTAALCMRMATVVLTNRLKASRNTELPAAVEESTPVSFRTTPVERPRCTEQPFLWKDRYILGGGTGSRAVWTTMYFLATFALGLTGATHTDRSDRLLPVMLGFGFVCFVPIIWAIRFDGLLAAEFRQQTWSSLMLLPIARGELLWSKLRAVEWEQRWIWLPAGLGAVLAAQESPAAVLMATAIAAAAGALFCQVSATNHLGPRRWWFGPVQGGAVVLLIVACLICFLLFDWWVGFWTALLLLGIASFALQQLVNWLLERWTEG